MKKIYKLRTHKFDIIINNETKVLILGSFPSLKSEENNFYYGNKTNRFYDVLSNILNLNNLKNETNNKKKEILLHNHIGLYDVIKSCKISNSSDNDILKDSIKVLPLDKILNNSNIKIIVLNGNMAYKIFCKYFPNYQSKAIKLPSTSSANARYSLEMLINEWKIIKNYL